MMPKRLRISLVIPVYNEESHLAACLRAAKNQLLPFDEIIVVDNNSTDQTANIAATFEGITLLKESRQGVVYARTAGFDAARGEIIARIDADTVLPADWTQNVLRILKDESIEAVSGLPEYYDMSFPRLANFVEKTFRRQLAYELRHMMFLQGANMAMRREAWVSTRQFMCKQSMMHEDFDLAIHLQEYGHKVVYDPTLIAKLSGRRVDVSFWQFLKYLQKCPHTYALHEVPNYGRMYRVIAVIIILYLPARILYRAYDENSERFSLAKLLLHRTAGRIDPTL